MHRIVLVISRGTDAVDIIVKRRYCDHDMISEGRIEGALFLSQSRGRFASAFVTCVAGHAPMVITWEEMDVVTI